MCTWQWCAIQWSLATGNLTIGFSNLFILCVNQWAYRLWTRLLLESWFAGSLTYTDEPYFLLAPSPSSSVLRNEASSFSMRDSVRQFAPTHHYCYAVALAIFITSGLHNIVGQAWVRQGRAWQVHYTQYGPQTKYTFYNTGTELTSKSMTLWISH